MIKGKIGENAGIIWHILEEVKEISIPDLQSKTSLSAEETSLAIGWLAREDKIFIHISNGMLILSQEEYPVEFSFG